MSNLAPKYRAALGPVFQALALLQDGNKPLSTQANLEVAKQVQKADLAFDVPAHTDDDVSSALANAAQAEGRAECREHLEAAYEALKVGLANLMPPVGWAWEQRDSEGESQSGGLFHNVEEAKRSYETFLHEVYDYEEDVYSVEWSEVDVAVYDATYRGWFGKVLCNGEEDETQDVTIKPWVWAPY